MVWVGGRVGDAMATPHDELFKATFSQLEDARAELMCVLPEAITRRIDWSTLSLISGEFSDPPFAHLYRGAGGVPAFHSGFCVRGG